MLVTVVAVPCAVGRKLGIVTTIVNPSDTCMSQHGVRGHVCFREEVAVEIAIARRAIDSSGWKGQWQLH